MYITLAVEDRLSEAVAKRLIADYAPDLQVFQTLGLRGYGYLRRNLPKLDEIARYLRPALVFTDLDNPASCPPALIQNWTQGIGLSPNLLFRVAILEIEAWLLADRDGIARWMSLADRRRIPANPESIVDPKRTIIELANRSRNRQLRRAIVPGRGIGANRIGPSYNEKMSEFATHHWNPAAARRSAPSLNRAIARIAELAAQPSA